MKKPKSHYFSLWLIFIIIGIFVLQNLIPGLTSNFLLNQNSWQQPYRFITSILLHSDVSHLFYNLLSLFFFGIILEKILGSKRFLAIFFLSGIIANLISINFYTASLGASGAIFGIIGCLFILRPKILVFAMGFPIPMYLATIVWIIIDIFRTMMPTNVGTYAHFSGLGIGILFGLYYYSRFKQKQKTKNPRIPEYYMMAWEKKYLGK